jgi:amino acid adenylation domain-containing protein
MNDENFKCLLAQEGIVLAGVNEIPRLPGPRIAEASYSQQRIWMNQMIAPESTVYNTLIAMQVDGCLNYQAMAQALETIVDRHESLRTCFKAIEGKPYQQVETFVPVNVKYVDLTKQDEPEQILSKILTCASQTPFSLESGPLFRFAVIRLATRRNVLLFALHHIVFDFVSSQVLFEEFKHLYEHYATGCVSSLPELAIQGLDYSEWERKQFEKQNDDTSLEFWKAWLGTGNQIASLELTSDQPLVPESGFLPANQDFAIPKDIIRKVQSLSVRFRVPRFVIWLVAFQILLHRYSGQDDVVVCVPHAQREIPCLERLIGFFVNFVPVKLSIQRGQCFREMLETIHERYLEATGSRSYPFNKLVEALSPRRDETGARLGSVGFGYQYSKAAPSRIGPLEIRFLPTGVPVAKSELALSVFETPYDGHAQLEFDATKFSTRLMKTMASQYFILLSQLLDTPERPIGSLEFGGVPDPSQFGQRDDTKHDCLHTAVEHQASIVTDAISLVVEDLHVSYGGLTARARCFASCLRDRFSVFPGDAVAVYLPRDADAYVCILALLQVGAVYVPLDTSNSPGYTAKLVRLAGVKHIIALSADELRSAMDGLSVGLISLSTLLQSCYSDYRSSSAVPVLGTDTAYVCFTSGSTGQSKGAFVAHHAISKHLSAFERTMNIERTDRILQFAALTFDVSIEQIFSAWCSGATLLPRGNEVWGAREFITFLHREQITLANPPTAYWNQVVNAGSDGGPFFLEPPLRCLVVGGEAMSSDIAGRCLRMSHAGVRLLNAYGPTEAVVTSTLREVTGDDIKQTGATVSIGFPFPGRRICVLDQHGLPVPDGAPGELCIAGPMLAEGYLQNPRATAAQFRPESLPESVHGTCPDSAGARIYRTGDRTRRLPDGSFEYLCRQDDEIKVRGVRVSPARIESALAEHPSLLETAVIVNAGASSKLSYPTSDNMVRTQDLPSLLEKIPEVVLEQCLFEIEKASDAVRGETGQTRELFSRDRSLMKRTPDFDLTLELKGDRFISTPRSFQRNWLLNRALDECADDLRELHILAQRFVAGTDRQEISHDLAEAVPEFVAGQLIMAGQNVMQSWQRPLMKALAKAVSKSRGDILEIGFGMGISADFIQSFGVQNHVILESNEAIAAAGKRWRDRYPHRKISVVHARWQDVIDELGEFDGIIFDTYPATESEFRRYVLGDATFAAHFFPHASKHLKDGGIFTYYSNEIDCLSRRHQRDLLKWFSSFQVSVVRDLRPPLESQNWWSDSMAVVRACRETLPSQNDAIIGTQALI